jgi:pyruvate,water dikinase
LGVGENIVKGAITPDEWMVFKPTLENTKLNPILKRRPKRIHDDLCRKDEETSENTIINNHICRKQNQFSLKKRSHPWCYKIEKHYKTYGY